MNLRENPVRDTSSVGVSENIDTSASVKYRYIASAEHQNTSFAAYARIGIGDTAPLMRQQRSTSAVTKARVSSAPGNKKGGDETSPPFLKRLLGLLNDL